MRSFYHSIPPFQSISKVKFRNPAQRPFPLPHPCTPQTISPTLSIPYLSHIPRPPTAPRIIPPVQNPWFALYAARSTNHGTSPLPYLPLLSQTTSNYLAANHLFFTSRKIKSRTKQVVSRRATESISLNWSSNVQ